METAHDNRRGKTSGPSVPRIVKVFISSTFRDFQKERDELVKKTFPALRDFCANRNIVFVDVDLRWGITESQAEAGEILPICFAEIDNCRPYFVGLLGERYGWVPRHVPENLIQQQPWLSDHGDRSITELEILYGAVRNGADTGRRFFYFRSPAYRRSLRPENQGDYGSEDAGSAGKLARLKDLIKEEAERGTLELVESYLDPEQLAELVFQDLKDAIESDYPQSEYDEFEQERLGQQIYIDSRTGILAKRTGPLGSMVKLLEASFLPLVLFGESGSGKTSQLVRLAAELREEYGQCYIFANFVGATAKSTDYAWIIRRLLKELSFLHGSGEKIPEGNSDLVKFFFRYLAELPDQPPVFLLLDGLDQIADVEDALAYHWLPEQFPGNVRVAISVSNALALEAFKERGWRVVEMPALTPLEQTEMVARYLGRYGKRLDATQTKTVLGAKQASLPLYLRAFLEEIRIVGEFAKLNERIDHYLASWDPVELFEKILQRLEADYEAGYPGLVRSAFSLIAKSKYGLTESELQGILGVPRIAWSQLHLAVQESLSNTMGYISFFHDFLKRAVENRYMGTPEAGKSVHLRLAVYFEKSGDIDRKADELPWQLAKAEEWERLRDCLVRFDVFMNLSNRNREMDLIGYWKILHPRYSAGEAYTQALDRYEATKPSRTRLELRMKAVADFLSRFGAVREALAILQKLKEMDDETFKLDYLGELQNRRINNLVELASKLGETQQFEKAEPFVLQALEIFKKLPEQPKEDKANLLNSLAFAQKNTGKPADAELNYRAAISLDPQPVYQNNLATLLKEQGLYEEAEGLFRNALEGLSESDSYRAVILSNLGDILQAKRNSIEAEKCYRAAIEIYKARLGPAHFHVAVNLSRLADLLLWTMRPGEAEKAIKEAISIFETSLGPEHDRIRSAYTQLEMIAIANALHRRSQALRAGRGGD